MERNVGVIARGIRGPIIRPKDDLVNIIVDSLEKAIKSDNIILNNHDILGITEGVVAKAQNNFVLIDDIKKDIRAKYKDEVGIVFPILSRNRFASILKGIAMGVEKVYIQLSYPADEVGNRLITEDMLDKAGLNPYLDTITEEKFYSLFKLLNHSVTGVDYVELYKQICQGRATIFFSNDPRAILKYTKKVLVADIHSRERTKRMLKEASADIVYGLDDIMNKPIGDSGYNAKYGLLGSNLATDNKLKLFPKDCNEFVINVQREIQKRFKINIEVLVYGDGGYKDPSEGIWELADPVISPGYTKGLEGSLNEIKLKYITDTLLNDLDQQTAQKKLKDLIDKQSKSNKDLAKGTTPRKIVNIIGSMCDLISGSGSKGTPFVLIQGYFDNYSDRY